MRMTRSIALVTLVLGLGVPDAIGSTRLPPSSGALECLALTLYWEAGSELREGMIGVGWVVFNRRAHPDFPPTVCGVVRQGGDQPGCQFAYWCDGRSDTPENQTAWALAVSVAASMLYAPAPDPTGGALFFHSASLERVPWRIPREQTARIGKHVYYR